MKRQFYLDEVERDLIRCALEFWSAQISYDSAGKAHVKCGEFTQRRIAALQKRLAEQGQPVAHLKTA